MWKIGKKRRGSCKMPSNLNENDFAGAEFSPGSLVWAKLTGFPWWPAMVEDCPDVQDYFMPYTNSEHEYHVNFFGSKPLRNWIKASNIKDFTITPHMSPKAKKNKDLQKSIEQATEALKIPSKERLKNYSFAVRYKGPWAQIEKLEKVELPPNCMKRKGRKKSTEPKSRVIPEEPGVKPDCPQTSTTKKANNSKLKPGTVTKRKSFDSDEFQSTFSQQPKVEKNHRDGTKFDVLDETGTKDVQQPSGKYVPQSLDSETKIITNGEKCEENPSYANKEENPSYANKEETKSAKNECQQPHFDEGSDQFQESQTANLGEVSDTKLKSDDDFQSNGRDIPLEVPDKEKNVECINIEDSTDSNDTIVLTDIELDEMTSPDLKVYTEFVNKKYPPIDFNVYAKSSSYNVGDTNSSIENSNLDIDMEQETKCPENESTIDEKSPGDLKENKSTIDDENAVELTENDHEGAAEHSEMDLGRYILDTDPLLMRNYYESCYYPKRGQYLKRREWKKNGELTDELSNSNNSKYMPYSTCRRRNMK